ncbi:hypothetical protein D3C76_1766920 [compost metagenome]
MLRLELQGVPLQLVEILIIQTDLDLVLVPVSFVVVGHLVIPCSLGESFGLISYVLGPVQALR